MGLHDFLTDRWTEDEQLAKAAAGATAWRSDNPPKATIVSRAGERLLTLDFEDQLRADESTLALFRYFAESAMPGRVLADIASKRALLDLHQDLGADFYSPDHPDADQDGVVRPNGLHECAECHHAEWPCPTVRHLAAVYSRHPDYDPEWAPQQ